MKIRTHPFAAHFFAFVFLSITILVLYSNTLKSSWHLDDQPNIINNYYLHLDSLHLEKLVKTFFTDPRNPEQLSNRPYRPVACLTFALNWYFGQDNVVGYHIVNTSIHILSAFFLFLFVLNLFDSPRLKKNIFGNPVFIAFLTSVLWATNPVQTQAVTYIVQRMAQLAALFYILGLYAYIKARLTCSHRSRLIWFALSTLSCLLGVYSKPNAAMMPMAIILIEIAFFQNLSDRMTKNRVFLVVLIMGVLILLAGTALFMQGDPLSFLDLYRIRSFTLSERLLTQPRVILFYLSQIFFPTPDRFSISHDIVLSSSLLKPWTTAPSILIIFILVGISISQIGKRPIISFSILFFFLNHIIESSVIGLELIFEHRNYLPSLFLFMPAACLISYLAVTYKNKKFIYASALLSTIFLITIFSVNTYIRNQVWKDDITLWMDAASKAPNHSRAFQNLAVKMAWGDGSKHPNRYDMALSMFEDALKKYFPASYVEAEIYGNMALIYLHHKNNPKKAFAYFSKAIEADPENLKIRRELIEAYVINRDFESAYEQIETLLSKDSENGRYLNLKGHILLWQNKYDDAISCFNRAYPLLGDKSSVLLNISVTFSLAGEYSSAEQILLESIDYFPDDMTFYFAAIENSTRADEKNKANFFAGIMLKQFSDEEIKMGLESFTDNPKFAPLHARPISLAIENYKAGTFYEN